MKILNLREIKDSIRSAWTRLSLNLDFLPSNNTSEIVLRNLVISQLPQNHPALQIFEEAFNNIRNYYFRSFTRYSDDSLSFNGEHNSTTYSEAIRNIYNYGLENGASVIQLDTLPKFDGSLLRFGEDKLFIIIYDANFPAKQHAMVGDIRSRSLEAYENAYDNPYRSFDQIHSDPNIPFLNETILFVLEIDVSYTILEDFPVVGKLEGMSEMEA
jgi:hypothetical protein